MEFEIIETQNRRPDIINRKKPSKLQNSHQNPGLAYLGFEQPGPGAPLLGLAKSKYYNVYN